MSVLEVKNLCKRFGDVRVLKGIDLKLERGEVLSIIGSSGGGKTTLLRCLNFLEKANSGEILVNDKSVYCAVEGEKPVVTPEAQLSFGLVFQQFNLFPQYSVIENLMLAPKLRAKAEHKKTGRETESLQEIRARAEQLLATVGLTEKADAYPCQLSGGQQQRVAIARALYMEPDVILADEPTGNLDTATAENVTDLLLSLRDELKQTLVIVTHDERLAARADRAYRMIDGEMYVRR